MITKTKIRRSTQSFQKVKKEVARDVLANHNKRELHWKNHKKTDNNRYCWDPDDPEGGCDPNSERAASDGIDTERCEQTFSWLARFKHTARYMRPGHFMFFMLLRYNRLLAIVAPDHEQEQ